MKRSKERERERDGLSMATPEERLEELGITSAGRRPSRLRRTAPAVRVGDLVFISGQGPTRDGKPVWTGRVGADLTLEEGYEAAKLVMINALAVLKQEIGSLDNVVRIVKVLGWVNSAPDFDRQPMVINGASELLEQVLAKRKARQIRRVGAHIAVWFCR